MVLFLFTSALISFTELRIIVSFERLSSEKFEILAINCERVSIVSNWMLVSWQIFCRFGLLPSGWAFSMLMIGVSMIEDICKRKIENTPVYSSRVRVQVKVFYLGSLSFGRFKKVARNSELTNMK